MVNITTVYIYVFVMSYDNFPRQFDLLDTPQIISFIQYIIYIVNRKMNKKWEINSMKIQESAM